MMKNCYSQLKLHSLSDSLGRPVSPDLPLQHVVPGGEVPEGTSAQIAGLARK